MLNKQLFVGNIAWTATEDDVREAFEAERVNVESVRIMKDMESGKSRGFGFVTVDRADDMNGVVERMNGLTVCGRKINVEQARGVGSSRKA